VARHWASQDQCPAPPTLPVLKTKKVDELAYAESDGYRAWGTFHRKRARFNVWAQKKGEPRRRVNRGTSHAAMGSVDGQRLVYQEIRFPGGRSVVRLYDMDTGGRTNPGRRVNSGMWEYWPSISGDWIMFFRINRKETRDWAFLYNLKTKQRRRLDVVTGGRGRMLGGQVSVSVDGAYAAWTKCGPKRCHVFRYDIEARQKTRIPNPRGRRQYAAAVDPRGTVYYARGGFRCGRNVSIWKHSPGQAPTKLVSLPRNIDLSRGFVYHNTGDARNQYSFDRLRCRTGRSDIFELLDDLT